MFLAGQEEGDYTFAAPLSPNHRVYLHNVLHVAVSAGVPCASISVVK